ncbi:MAG: hypothetical protein U5N86_08355, partial [Planctomycetota bacterium]|nr:hypothetical protein [Planctomycetota bacterium]
SVWGRGFLALIVPGDPAKTDRIAFDNMYEYEQLTVAETFDYVDQSGSANLSRLEGLQNDGVYGIYDKVDMADKTVTGLGNSINGEVYSDADMSFSMLNTVLGMTGTASYEMLREEGLQSGLDSFHFNLDGTASFDGTIDVSTTDTGGSIRFPIFTQLFPITDKGEVPMGIMLELIGNVQYNGSDPLDQQIAVDYEIPVTEDFTYDPVNGWVRTGTKRRAVVNHQMDSITQTEQDNNLYIRLELTFAVVIGGQCAGYSGMEMWFDSALWRESSTQPTDFGNITVTAEDHLIEADQVYWFAFYGENWLFGDDTSKADMSPSHMRYIKGYERFDKFELYRNVVYPILGAIKGTGANDIVMLTTSGASADVVDNKFVMYVNSTGDHTIEAQNVPEDYYLIGTTQVQ